MNLPKKQKRIPRWLPTTVLLMAIIAIILFIYIIVTYIDGNSYRHSVTPTPEPTPTETPVPTEDPVKILSEKPLVSEDTSSTYFADIQGYLSETLGDSFDAGSLTLSKKDTPVSGTTLFYARYKKDGIYAVSELAVSDTISDAALVPDLSGFLLYSRQQTDVEVLYVQALVNNFYYYRNNEDTESLAALLTTGAVSDAEGIVERMEYIDSVTLTGLLTHPITSDTADMMAIVSEDIRFLGIDTPAPGLSELLLSFDENYYPLIFIGETDSSCDAERDAYKSTAAFKAMQANTEAALNTALESDEKLKAAYENMTK